MLFGGGASSPIHGHSLFFLSFTSSSRSLAAAAEEQGIHGSAFYVREAQSKGLNIVSALTMDMIGYSNR